jgi:hypothetical protein
MTKYHLEQVVANINVFTKNQLLYMLYADGIEYMDDWNYGELLHFVTDHYQYEIDEPSYF